MDLVPLQTRACSAGRDRRFHPLAWFEIDSAGLPFDLGGAMNHGLLPPQWFGVLADTLAGGFLPSFTRTVKRKAIERAKFYLFDPGGCAIFTRRQPYPGARASGASQELARSWPVRAPHARLRSDARRLGARCTVREYRGTMKTISVRELRAHWADVEKQVRNGETFEVLNRGRGAALIIPPRPRRVLTWDDHLATVPSSGRSAEETVRYDREGRW